VELETEMSFLLVVRLEQPLVGSVGSRARVLWTRQVLASVLLKEVVYPGASVVTMEVMLASFMTPLELGVMGGRVNR
jgi:hypothetical protein